MCVVPGENCGRAFVRSMVNRMILCLQLVLPVGGCGKAKLGYLFKNKDILMRAVMHSSKVRIAVIQLFGFDTSIACGARFDHRVPWS